MSKLKKEIPRFIVAGICAVATDAILYFLLKNIIAYSQAKAVSFICGACVAYAINKFWTFESKKKSAREPVLFILLYLCTLCANVLVNKLALMLFPEFYVPAFLCATGTSTILNFAGQKWVVFK